MNEMADEMPQASSSKPTESKTTSGEQSGQMTVIDDVDDNSVSGKSVGSNDTPPKSYSRSRSTSRSSSRSGTFHMLQHMKISHATTGCVHNLLL